MRIETPNYEIVIHDNGTTGHFCHKRLGMHQAGGTLFFKDKELKRFTGMISLPNEILTALRRNGFVARFHGHHN